MDDPKFLRALCTIDVDTLIKYDDGSVTTVLPFITRCALCSNEEQCHIWNRKKQALIKLLLNFPDVNFLVESLSTDFSEVASDCHDQLILR